MLQHPNKRYAFSSHSLLSLVSWLGLALLEWGLVEKLTYILISWSIGRNWNEAVKLINTLHVLRWIASMMGNSASWKFISVLAIEDIDTIFQRSVNYMSVRLSNLAEQCLYINGKLQLIHQLFIRCITFTYLKIIATFGQGNCIGTII